MVNISKLILIETAIYLFVSLTSFKTINKETNNKWLVGTWQYKTSKLSSALTESFRFFNNDTFTYTPSGYENLNPLRKITGQYIVSDNKLKLKVLHVTIISGFKILEADHGFQSGPFQIKGGNAAIINQNDKEFSEHSLEIVKSLKSDKVIHVKIDEDDYFKISDDPNAYKGN